MGTPVQITAALNGELARVAKGTTNDTLKTKNQYITDILAVLAVHQSGDKTIMGNEGLSQQGKLEALKKLGTTQTAPALKWLREKITDLQAKDQRYRVQFFVVESGIKDAVERTLMYTYLWSQLDPLDQAARVTQFIQASERDDLRMMAAMLEHPFGPMINEDVKERALTERATRLTPQAVENFEQTQILLEFMVMIRGWLGRWLYSEVGVEVSVIRQCFGDEVAEALSGIRPEQLTGAGA
jgi:hypothetical protein